MPEVASLYSGAMTGTKDFRQQWGIPLEKASIEERFAPVRLRYEQMTGVKGCNENAIMHHRLSLLAQPVAAAVNPLRTMRVLYDTAAKDSPDAPHGKVHG